MCVYMYRHMHTFMYTLDNMTTHQFGNDLLVLQNE